MVLRANGVPSDRLSRVCEAIHYGIDNQFRAINIKSRDLTPPFPTFVIYSYVKKWVFYKLINKGNEIISNHKVAAVITINSL